MVNLHLSKLAAVALALSHQISACTTDFDATKRTETGYPQVINGTDGPADAATSGFVINHFSLIVNNLTESRYFCMYKSSAVCSIVRGVLSTYSCLVIENPELVSRLLHLHESVLTMP